MSLLKFYLFSPSPLSAVLSFFLFLSTSGSRKTLENKRWVDPSLYSHKFLVGRAVEKNLMFLMGLMQKKPCILNIPRNWFSRKCSLCTVVHKNVCTCCLLASVQCVQYHVYIDICTVQRLHCLNYE